MFSTELHKINVTLALKDTEQIHFRQMSDYFTELSSSGASLSQISNLILDYCFQLKIPKTCDFMTLNFCNILILEFIEQFWVLRDTEQCVEISSCFCRPGLGLFFYVKDVVKGRRGSL